LIDELYKQSAPAASANRQLFEPQESGHGPIAWLRNIRQVIEDPELSHAQAVVIIAIILRADNQDGLAWAGYRSLAKNCRTSTSTVRLAMQRAGKYIEAVGVGKQGATRYKVKAQRLEKRSGEQSASAIEARRIDQRSASAATIAHKLTPITNPSSNPIKKSAADKPPPDPRVRDFVGWFCEAYQKVRGVKYFVQGAKDGAMVKRLLQTLSPEELKAAAQAMLADSWGSQRASIGLLSSQINAWRGQPQKAAGKARPSFNPAPIGQSYNGLAKRFE
jgi:hypothetical protein